MEPQPPFIQQTQIVIFEAPNISPPNRKGWRSQLTQSTLEETHDLPRFQKKEHLTLFKGLQTPINMKNKIKH